MISHYRWRRNSIIVRIPSLGIKSERLVGGGDLIPLFSCSTVWYSRLKTVTWRLRGYEAADTRPGDLFTFSSCSLILTISAKLAWENFEQRGLYCMWASARFKPNMTGHSFVESWTDFTSSQQTDLS